MSDQPTQPVETQAETTPAPEGETLDGEPFDAARAKTLIEKLRAEIKGLKPKAKQAEELATAEQKRKEAEMTEIQKLQTELDKAKAEAKALQLSQMRQAAAEKVGLPLVFADRLRGETPDDLEADAKKLLEALPKASKPPVNPTNPGAGASQGETIEQQRARIHGRGVDVLDPEYARTHGGGVVWNDKTLTNQ